MAVEFLQDTNINGTFVVKDSGGANELLVSDGVTRVYSTLRLDLDILLAGGYGSAGQVLTSQGSGTAATWETVSGSGTVDGTGSATKLAFWQDADTITYDTNLYFTNGDGKLYVDAGIYAAGDTNTGITLPGSDTIRLTAGGGTIWTATTTSITTDLKYGVQNTVESYNASYTKPTASSQFRGELADFGTTGSGLSAGDIVYLTTSGALARWDLTGANTTASVTRMLAMYTGSGFLLRGLARLTGWTLPANGQPIYASSTGGDFTGTEPTSGNVRILGYTADNANSTIYFCPDNTWVEIA